MEKISSGIEGLDSLTDSLYIGDNVVWEVDAGTSSDIFIQNFIGRSFQESEKVIYISFNRSPQTILNEIGAILSPENFTLIDCFTTGKGKNDNAFLKFYEKKTPAQVIKIDNPRNIEQFSEVLNAIEDRLPPGARYVFDSLTGMQDLWGDESETHRFFTYMCPRLYDLGTVAYWILEKDAHSQKFKANLRHITQVVFDLYKRKNSLYIKALKLEGRRDWEVFKPHLYEIHGNEITIGLLKKEPVADIGTRIKEARTRTGMSQKELAEKVDLTPSFLSQLENNQVSPSLNTFLQICRALGINPGQFLEPGVQKTTPWLIKKAAALSMNPTREGGASIYHIVPGEKLSVKWIVMPPGSALNGHFFDYCKDEAIYIAEGTLSVTVEGRVERLEEGDVLYLKDSFPTQWKNEGGGEAKILAVW